MRYFDIHTIKTAIESLQEISANWLIPAFVFAANDVGTESPVDMSKKLGTDQFLDRYFNGRLIGIPSFRSGNNLLRPRLKGIRWDRGDFANDYIIRQDTKMWGNLFSSRGYREMRLKGYIDGEKTIARLTQNFQSAFESEILETFQFEDFLVWLFAFEGFPDEIGGWDDLFAYLLHEHLKLSEFKEPYRGRFRLTDGRPWPQTLAERPDNATFLNELAPRLAAFLSAPPPDGANEKEARAMVQISRDDAVLNVVQNSISKKISHTFLLAGPPGTGKTTYAHEIARFLADGDENRILFLQFHPAFGYDDFVEGFRPVEARDVDGKPAGVTYKLRPRHFLTFAKRARSDSKNLYVLVVDEINRGDITRIFGELLTYLELNYRDTEFTLAVSGTRITIPHNLVLLATANPFDRSVTDLDDALLRRFIVITLEPDKLFLENFLTKQGVDERLVNRTLRLFDILNDAFPSGFGHTNFLQVRSFDDLADVWNGRVKLGLRRALFHDRQKFDEIQSEVDQLLRIEQDQVAHEDENNEP